MLRFKYAKPKSALYICQYIRPFEHKGGTDGDTSTGAPAELFGGVGLRQGAN